MNNPIVRAFLMVAGMFYWTIQLATMAITGAICLLAWLMNLLCAKIFGAHNYGMSLSCLWILSGAVFLKLLGNGTANNMVYTATKGEMSFDDAWAFCIDNFKKGLEED